MIAIVGSGPAGVAAASALLERGANVLMLDGGEELEPERRLLLDRLRASPPDAWDPDDVQLLKGGMEAGPSGVPVKLAWGSDFAYRDVSPSRFDLTRVDVHASYARGGHSNLWGAALLPYRRRELADWPLGPGALDAHFAAVLSLVEHRAPRDDLSSAFPELPPSAAPPLPPGSQVAGLLEGMRARRDELAAAGVRFGGARLAVRSRQAPACVACGLCLYGCPLDLIWSANHGAEVLARRGGLVQRSGVVVERVTESEVGVTLAVRDRRTGLLEQVSAARAILAAGVLGSTRLVLEAQGREGVTIPVRCSDYFVAPFVRWARARGVAAERQHTLAQAFVEVETPEVDANLVHLQFYGHNDLLGTAVARAFGPLAPLAGLAGPLVERLLVIQGYLHQDSSSRLHARLRQDGVLEVIGAPNRMAQTVARRALAHLASHAAAFGGLPLLPMLRVGLPGAGNHFGASFPMRAAPGPLESDLLGRPFGLQRVHVADASTFSAVAAPTITLTIMAHAHRIGAGLPLDRASPARDATRTA